MATDIDNATAASRERRRLLAIGIAAGMLVFGIIWFVTTRFIVGQSTTYSLWSTAIVTLLWGAFMAAMLRMRARRATASGSTQTSRHETS